jgi:hypothetical protein
MFRLLETDPWIFLLGGMYFEDKHDLKKPLSSLQKLPRPVQDPYSGKILLEVRFHPF